MCVDMKKCPVSGDVVDGLPTSDVGHPLDPLFCFFVEVPDFKPLSTKWAGRRLPINGNAAPGFALRSTWLRAETAQGKLKTINWSVTCPAPGLSEPPAR
jgi:hypothetical protein